MLLESGAPHTLVALAAAGHGVAIVPSNLRFARKALRVARVLHGGRPLGAWLAVSWDPRRFLPPYADHFVAELVEHTRRSYPGREFERVAPLPPRPADLRAPARP